MRRGFESIDAMLAYVERRINDKLNEVRFRTARLLQRQGASRAELDDTMAWLEREMQKALNEQLALMREQLPEFTRLH
jgi:hypothetical protein